LICFAAFGPVWSWPGPNLLVDGLVECFKPQPDCEMVELLDET